MDRHPADNIIHLVQIHTTITRRKLKATSEVVRNVEQDFLDPDFRQERRDRLPCRALLVRANVGESTCQTLAPFEM